MGYVSKKSRFSKKSKWKALFIFPLIFFSSAIASSQSIFIQNTGRDTLSFLPGQIVTLFFNVENKLDSPLELIPEAEVPARWNLLIKDYQYTLGPDAKENRLITLYIPEETEVGYYPVFYRVRSKQNFQTNGYVKQMIRVEPFHKLSMEFFQIPDVIRESEIVPIRFFVQNLGNVRDSICLSTKCDEDGFVELPVKAFQLEPKEVREVTAFIKAERGFAGNRSFCMSVSASSFMHQQDEVKISACMDLIPKSNWKPDLFHRIPGEVTLMQVFTSGKGLAEAIQGEIRGGGPITEKGDRFVSFHLRGPDQYKKSFLAEHDQWTVQYQSPRFRAVAGDQTYKLSSLTESSRWGRGLALGITQNRFHFDTYVSRTLWRAVNWKEWAASLQYDFNRFAFMKMNALSKNEGESYRQVYSVEGQLKPFEESTVSSELAMDSGLKHPAYQVNFSGLSDRLVYAVRFLKADNEFAGYYRDTEYQSYNLSVRLRNNIRVSTQFVSDKQNFELDTTKYAAPLSRNVTSRLHYNPWEKTFIKISHVFQKMEDRLDDASFDYQENRMEFELNQRIANITASVVSEIGETDNYLTDQSGRSSNFLFGLDYTPNRKHSYYAYVRTDNNLRYFDTRYRRTEVGFKGQYRPDKQSVYALSFRTNYSPESYFFYRDILEARVQHRFSSGMNLDLVLHRTLMQNSLDRKDNAGRIKLSLPFGIPVAKKQNVGGLRGRVTDSALIPMANVQVSINGYSTLTDKNGEFIFPGLTSGVYWLHLEKNNRTLNMVPSTQMPMKLMISGGREQVVSLILVEKASLAGRVMLCPHTSDSSSNVSASNLDHYYILESAPGIMVRFGQDTLAAGDCYGLKSIIVEMKMGDEVHRRISNEKGEFTFQDLRPGKWTLRFYKNNLPEYYQFENEIYELDLAPGEERWMEAKAVPKKRRIQFLQEGGTIQIQNQPNR